MDSPYSEQGGQRVKAAKDLLIDHLDTKQRYLEELNLQMTSGWYFFSGQNCSP